MVQIDMDMPKSCLECPFRDPYMKCCTLMPKIPAWLAETEVCMNKRSIHCPLKEVNKNDK